MMHRNMTCLEKRYMIWQIHKHGKASIQIIKLKFKETIRIASWGQISHTN